MKQLKKRGKTLKLENFLFFSVDNLKLQKSFPLNMWNYAYLCRNINRKNLKNVRMEFILNCLGYDLLKYYRRWLSMHHNQTEYRNWKSIDAHSCFYNAQKWLHAPFFIAETSVWLLLECIEKAATALNFKLVQLLQPLIWYQICILCPRKNESTLD